MLQEAAHLFKVIIESKTSLQCAFISRIVEVLDLLILDGYKKYRDIFNLTVVCSPGYYSLYICVKTLICLISRYSAGVYKHRIYLI